MDRENYKNPDEIPSAEEMVQGFAELDPSENFLPVGQRVKAMEKAVENAHAQAPTAVGDQFLDILYECYKQELRKISN